MIGMKREDDQSSNIWLVPWLQQRSRQAGFSYARTNPRSTYGSQQQLIRHTCATCFVSRPNKLVTGTAGGTDETFSLENNDTKSTIFSETTRSEIHGFKLECKGRTRDARMAPAASWTVTHPQNTPFLDSSSLHECSCVHTTHAPWQKAVVLKWNSHSTARDTQPTVQLYARVVTDPSPEIHHLFWK